MAGGQAARAGEGSLLVKEDERHQEDEGGIKRRKKGTRVTIGGGGPITYSPLLKIQVILNIDTVFKIQV
jgi:hypothetical protein